jgi:hypothetical protein
LCMLNKCFATAPVVMFFNLLQMETNSVIITSTDVC